MNYCVRLPSGEVVALTLEDAVKFDAYLFTKMEGATDPDRVVMQRLRDDLRRRMQPETHFDDHYTPPGYEPGWVPGT